MRFALRALVLSALLALLACSTVQVSSDYDQTRDFSAYHKYAWIPGKPAPTGLPRLDTPMVQQRIHNGIDNALASKGYAQVAAAPDFFVKYQLTAEQKLDVRNDNDAFLYGADGFEIGTPATTIRQYNEGTLIIDVYDAKEKKLVWRGIGQGRLRAQGAAVDPTQSEQQIFKAASEVLANFPPKPK